MAAAKKRAPAKTAPRARKTTKKATPLALVERAPLVPFSAMFHDNERLALKCTCKFPDGCNGSRLISCSGCEEAPGGIEPGICVCEACDGEGLTGCQGCDTCSAAECAGCGKRDANIKAVEGETWTCSPECTRKTLTVAS